MKKVKKFADGGGSEAETMPETIADNNPSAATPVEQDPEIEQAAPKAHETAQNLATPTSPSQAPVMPPQPTTPQEYDMHDTQHMQDAATKQITPMTYQSMFANKSTLGKIGTLFGLMLSGAGSGLAHQSNALLDMMNKQINNDLESQKTNVSNAQNFLTLSFQHELQQAQQKRYQYENALTQSQMGIAPAQIAQAQATTKGIGIENVAKALKTEALAKAINPSASPYGTSGPTIPATTPNGQNGIQNIPSPLPPHPDDVKHAAMVAPLRAENSMRIAAAQNLADSIGNNPQAQAMFKTQVLPGILAANQQNNAKIGAMDAVANPAQAALNGDVVTDRNLLNQKIALRAMDPSIPGSIDQDTANKEIAAMQQNRILYAQAVDAAKQLAVMPNHGQINPVVSSALKGIGGVGAAIMGLIGGGPAGGVAGAGAGNSINEGANTAQEYLERPRTRLTKILKQAGIDADAILPSRADKQEDLGKVWESMNKAFAIRDAGLGQNLNTLGLKAPFPYQSYVAGERSAPQNQNFNTAGISDKDMKRFAQ